MGKIAGGLLVLFIVASCSPVPVQPTPGGGSGTSGAAASSGTSGTPPQIGGAQRGQYVWEKVMEGVFMGASIGGPYGAGVGLVFGGLIGLFTADAHYAQLNAQIESEHAKDRELEAQLEHELERQRALEAEIVGSAPAAPKATSPGEAASKPASGGEISGQQKSPRVGEQASLTKPADRPQPPAPGFKNVEVKDMNQDGIPDLWIYYNPRKPGEIVRQEEDTNADGRVDAWSTFSEGKLVRREVDSKGDGRPDILYLYENESIAVEERDEHGKGRASFRAHYQNGRVVKLERDTTGDGKVDLWVYYDPSKEGQVVLKEEQDLDGNGSPDLWSFYESGHLVRRDVSAVGLQFLSGKDKDAPVFNPPDLPSRPKS